MKLKQDLRTINKPTKLIQLDKIQEINNHARLKGFKKASKHVGELIERDMNKIENNPKFILNRAKGLFR